MQRTKQGDRGVSPVIGVVLMVAITVVLAAGIASIALNTGDDVSETGEASYQYNGNGVFEVKKLGEGTTLKAVGKSSAGDNNEPEETFNTEGKFDRSGNLGSASYDGDGTTSPTDTETLELYLVKGGEETFIEEVDY